MRAADDGRCCHFTGRLALFLLALFLLALFLLPALGLPYRRQARSRIGSAEVLRRSCALARRERVIGGCEIAPKVAIFERESWASWQAARMRRVQDCIPARGREDEEQEGEEKSRQLGIGGGDG